MPCSNASVARGNAGKVEVDDNLIARIKQWSLTTTSAPQAFGDSDSGGYTNRVPGRLDATGSLTGVYDMDDPVYDLFVPGDVVELVLWERTAKYWAFPCVVMDNFRVTFNMDTKEAVEWSADFAADGIFYAPGQSGAPAESYPA